MARFVALFRAVNLVSHNRVAMADLRQLFDDLSMTNVRTVVQTGNVLFDTKAVSTGSLEALVEAATASTLALTTDVMVRTRETIEQLVATNPFPLEAANDPGHLVVMFLKKAPPAAAVAALRAAIKGRETVQAVGAHLFTVYPDGIGTSKLTTAVIERALGTRATGRNWNTMLKLIEPAEAAVATRQRGR